MAFAESNFTSNEISPQYGAGCVTTRVTVSPRFHDERGSIETNPDESGDDGGDDGAAGADGAPREEPAEEAEEEAEEEEAVASPLSSTRGEGSPRDDDDDARAGDDDDAAGRACSMGFTDVSGVSGTEAETETDDSGGDAVEGAARAMATLSLDPPRRESFLEVQLSHSR